MMNVDRRYSNLLNKLINASIDLRAYLKLRKVKGYMSVSENDHLRDNLFELCYEIREFAPRLQHGIAPEDKLAFRLAGDAVASAAVCLMSGCHDCPTYISVNVDKLESSLRALMVNIHKLNSSAAATPV